MSYTTSSGTTVTKRGSGTPALGKSYAFTASPELEAELGESWQGVLSAEEEQERALMDAVGSLAGAEQRGRMAIQGEIGRGMAGAMGQAGGMPVGGGSAAALRQQGLEGGMAEARFEAETVPGLNIARAEAAQNLADLKKSQGEGQAAKRVEAMNQINMIKARHEGFFTDDTSAMTRDIIALAESTVDPATRDFYYQEASRIRSTSSNLFTRLGGRSL